MDDKIEKVIALAGNEHRYQYFTLAVIVFLWINCNFISVVIPYLERAPLVNYIDRDGNHTNVSLTNEVCDKIHEFHHKHHFEIVEYFKYSWITEYHLECKKAETGLIGSVAFAGNTAGGFVFSFINKLISHKKILIISSILFCIATFLCTIVTSIEYFYFLLVSEFFMGLFGNCLCYSSLVIAQEVVSNEKRSLFSSIINVGYSLSGILYSIAFLFAKDWRLIFYILIVASLITLVLIIFFIYDSPRGFINQNNYEKTMEILEGIASFNGKLEEFRESIRQDEYQEIINIIKGEEPINLKTTIKEKKEEEKQEDKEEGEKEIENEENKEKEEIEEKEKEIDIKAINESKSQDMTTSLIKQENNDEEKGQELDILIHVDKTNNKNKITFCSLFKYPSITSKFLILNFLWIGTRAVFNGIAISSKSFPGNFYLNIIVLYIIESVAYCISGYLIEIRKLGRKGTLWIEYVIIIITLLLLAFLKLGTIPILGLNYVARFCGAGIEVVYYTYSIELYPTPVRSIAFGINATFGNGGSILAPMLFEYLPSWLFLTLFAIVCGVNSFLIIPLPETVGKPMIESIEELNKKKDSEKENS